MNATATDLAAWLKFHLAKGVGPDGKRRVSVKNLIETHTPQNLIPMQGSAKTQNPETVQLTYAMAWLVYDYRGKKVVSHGGMIDGFRVQITFLPEENLGFAVLCNLHDTRMTLALTNSLIDLYCGLEKKDWDAYYRKLVSDEAAERKKALEDRDKARDPEREDELFRSRDTRGVYTHPAYGSATVSEKGGECYSCYGNFACPLEHFESDTFRVTEGFFEEQLVPFVVSDGKVVSLKIRRAAVQGRISTQLTSAKNSSSRSSCLYIVRRSSSVPQATILPRDMIATRSQSFSTSRMMCVENRIVLPRPRSCLMLFSTARCTSTSSPAVGSSKISTGGSLTSARAIDTFCFMPVLIFAPGTSRKSCIWSVVKSSSIRDAEHVGRDVVQPAVVLDHFPRGHAVVDAGVRGQKADVVAHLGGLRHDVEAGDGRRCRPMGLSTVQSMRSVVVLPAPLGPSRPNTSPGPHGEVNGIDRRASAGPRRETTSTDRGLRSWDGYAPAARQESSRQGVCGAPLLVVRPGRVRDFELGRRHCRWRRSSALRRPVPWSVFSRRSSKSSGPATSTMLPFAATKNAVVPSSLAFQCGLRRQVEREVVRSAGRRP